VHRLAQRLSPRILCFAHGSPLVGGARRALEQALEADPGPDG